MELEDEGITSQEYVNFLEQMVDGKRSIVED